MLSAENQSELDSHLAAYGYRFGIVAIARTVHIDGRMVIELRAAIWRNRQLHSHRDVIHTHQIDRRTELAERFIDHVNVLFPMSPSSS
jgi:hypothetical protein